MPYDTQSLDARKAELERQRSLRIWENRWSTEKLNAESASIRAEEARLAGHEDVAADLEWASRLWAKPYASLADFKGAAFLEKRAARALAETGEKV